MKTCIVAVCGIWLGMFGGVSDLSAEAPATSLGAPKSSYTVSALPYQVLEGGEVKAVIVSNQEANDDVLPGHRAGYSGVGSLTHRRRDANLFVPAYAGLNFEHIHDGVTRDRDVLFEPRRAPMELRRIDDRTVDLYQAPSPHYGLESCLRYRILSDGCLEMTLECIPRRRSFANGYIGLFWASYIHQPESLDIHFLGRESKSPSDPPRWIRGVTPAHGVRATHLSATDDRQLPHDDDFPLSLVFNRSPYRYTSPWCYGVSHGMAFAMMFRDADAVRLTQSPSGGGVGNPAWDFQCFFEDYEVGRRQQLVMRALYVPFESPEQLSEAVAPHLKALRESR